VSKSSGNHARHVDINSSISIIAAIYISVVGPSVFIVQPGFVQGLVEYYSFSEQQAGYVAAAEMWGIAITAVLLIFLTSRVNWRKIIYFSLALMILGNFASLLFTDVVNFSIARVIVGIGAGSLISLGFTIIGLTNKPDRNFGYLVMWVLIYGAVLLAALPTIFHLVGLKGLIVFFALFASIAFPLVKYIPRSAEERTELPEDSVTAGFLYRLMAVTSIFIFFSGIGVIWTYLFLIGIFGGGTEQQVANALMLSQFLGAIGAFAAAKLGSRFGRIKPVVAGLAGCLLPMAFLFGKMGLFVYILAVGTFNFAYNMTHPYLYAVLSSIDRSGKIFRYAVAAQMLGLAVGPAIAASVVEAESFAGVLWCSIGFFLLTLFLILPPLFNHSLRIKQVYE
jgi:predicted MFS family arabinose efflux permease